MKLIIENKKAHFNYQINDTFEAGIQLKGTEVKSIYNKNVSLNDSYVVIKKNEAYILNMHIASYEFGNINNVDTNRTRKLLLHKREIIKLDFNRKKQAMTIVPIKLYWKNNKVKILIGLAKGKKLHDKRDAIKKREDNRQNKNYY